MKTRILLLASILIATVYTTIHADQNVPASHREAAAVWHKRLTDEVGFTNFFFGVPVTENTLNEGKQVTAESPTVAAAVRRCAVIKKVGKNYFWVTTKDTRQLQYHYPGNGPYHYLIDLQGGCVTIERMPNGEIKYLSHITLDLISFTCYGEGVCSPDFLPNPKDPVAIPNFFR